MDLSALRKLIGKQIKIKTRPEHSSIHARTFGGKVGKLFSTYQDPADGQVLGAIVGLSQVTWVDGRDLEVVG